MRFIGPSVFGLSTGSELVQGYVRLQSSGGKFTGAICFTDPLQRNFGSALSFTSAAGTTAYFSQVAQNEQYFTGLAGVNAGNRSAAVTIEVYDIDGKLLASGGTAIPPGGRFSRLLSELVGKLPAISRGYFIVQSTEPLVCFALFGTNDGTVLSAIPAQYPDTN
jgi:hypothetical protein